MFDFKKNIERTRELYKDSSPKMKDVLPSVWIPSADPLVRTLSDQKTLYKTGRIYYGSLLQANCALFKRFPMGNYPADIVYSTDLYFDEKPQELAAIARELYEYKSRIVAPPDIKTVVDAITDEMQRLFNIELPHSVTNGRDVYFTTIMIFRKHLPKRKLISPIFPILAKPESLQSSLILPHYYWTEDLKKHYCQKNEEAL